MTDVTGDPQDEPAVSAVRPYTFTGGRTRSRVEVPLEATTELTDEGRRRHWPTHEAAGRVAALAAERLSVAEISARAGLVLGVTRVLVGDLVDQGYVRLQQTLTDATPVDERISLIERTLRGLRDL